MFLIAFVFTALGTAIASTMEDFQGFQLIINFLIMPLFFLSGALFPLNNVPWFIGLFSRIDPLTYGVDGLRSTLINVSHFGLTTDFIILTVVSILFISIGSYLFSKIQV